MCILSLEKKTSRDSFIVLPRHERESKRKNARSPLAIKMRVARSIQAFVLLLTLLLFVTLRCAVASDSQALRDVFNAQVELARRQEAAMWEWPSSRTLKERKLWWYYWQPTFRCPFAERLPLLPGDTPKFICNVNLYDREDCIVYSFGVQSAAASTWDFFVADNFPHCQVYMYDPFVKNQRLSQLQAEVSKRPNIHYEQVGLGEKHTSNMRTLREIVEANGHSHKVITSLKVDIEGGEWQNFPDALADLTMLGTTVLEMQFEIHVAGVSLDRAAQFMRSLADYGYLRYSADPNFFCAMCMEYAWIHESVGTAILQPPTDLLTLANAKETAAAAAVHDDEDVQQLPNNLHTQIGRLRRRLNNHR